MTAPPNVALLISPHRRFRRDLLKGIAAYAASHGPWQFYHQEMIDIAGRSTWLADWPGDGVIARIECVETARLIQESGLPAVDVCGLQHWPGIASVDFDADQVACLAADHFLERGFRQFAYYGVPNVIYSESCQRAFERQVTAAGHTASSFLCPWREARITASIWEVLGLDPEADLTKWLAALPKPVGLFACNDFRARQVLDACRLAGLEVPDEVAILGMGNDDVLCELCSPQLSSIEPDARRFGVAAATALDRMMRGARGAMERIHIESHRIAVRSSTDVLMIDDPDVSAAVRFIRDRFGAKIGVDDVCRHVHLARRTLERRFELSLGRTPHEEIQRIRLRYVKDLLSTSDLRLEEIAALAGFEYPENLQRFFRAQTNQTPGQFRKTVR